MIRQVCREKALLLNEESQIAEEHPVIGLHDFKPSIAPQAINDPHISKVHHAVNPGVALRG